MKHLVFVLALALGLTTIQLHAQLGGALKKAKEKASGATSTATGTGTGTFDGTTVQPDACIFNVEGRLKSVNESYYPKFKANAEAYLNGPSALWFARKDMEG